MPSMYSLSKNYWELILCQPLTLGCLVGDSMRGIPDKQDGRGVRRTGSHRCWERDRKQMTHEIHNYNSVLSAERYTMPLEFII